MYCKRLQDCGIGADAVTAVRYIVLIVLAATVVLWRGKTGIATPRELAILSVATTALIVLPLFAFQLGIGRTTPLTAQVIRALGPVFVFALEQFDGRMHYSAADARVHSRLFGVRDRQQHRPRMERRSGA